MAQSTRRSVWAAAVLAAVALLGLVRWGIARGRSPALDVPQSVAARLPAHLEGFSLPSEAGEPTGDGRDLVSRAVPDGATPVELDGDGEELEREGGYFADNLAARISALQDERASFVVRCLPQDFERLHPEAVARMRGEPGALLGEILPIPDARSIAQSFRPIASRWLEKKYVEALTGKISSYYSREQASIDGKLPPITILQFLESERATVSSLIQRSDDFWILVSQYGQNIVEGKALAISGDEFCTRREELEAQVAEILWEASCQIENDLLEDVPQGVALWVRLSRVMTRYVYDDSYYVSDAELDAAERSYPFHLR